MLTQPPILALYNPTYKTNLITDASIEGYGACVEQECDGHWRPIAYASRKLNTAERNYGITEMEAGAVMFGIDKFTSYLLGIPFTIITDHQALQFINNKKNLSAKMTRWAMRLQEFNFTVIYKTPTYTRTPDALSRLPVIGVSDTERDVEDREFCYRTCLEETKPHYYVDHQTDSSDIEIECFYTSQQNNNKPSRRRGIRKRGSARTKEQKLEQQGCFYNDGDFLKMRAAKLRNAQQKDPLCKRIMDTLEDFAALTPQQREKYDAYHIDSETGLLIRNMGANKVIVLPKAEVVKLVEQYHCIGHAGIWGTYKRLTEKYYYRGLHSVVEEIVKACHTCQKNKGCIKKVPLAIDFNVDWPFHKVAIDVMGPFRKTDGEVYYCVVGIDYFTKYAEAAIIPKNDAEAMSEFLVNNIFSRHGSPDELVTDQGRPFISATYVLLCKKLGVKKIETLAYHPQSNGTVERVNRTLKKIISTMHEKSLIEWWRHLPKIMFAYNTTPHKTTNYSPFYLLYGRRPTIPLDSVIEMIIHNCTRNIDYTEDHIEGTWKMLKETALFHNN